MENREELRKEILFLQEQINKHVQSNGLNKYAELLCISRKLDNLINVWVKAELKL